MAATGHIPSTNWPRVDRLLAQRETRRGRGRFGDDRMATSRAYKNVLEGWFQAVIKEAGTGRQLWSCKHMHAGRRDAFNCAAMEIIRSLPKST